MTDAYLQFVSAKVAVAPSLGFDVADSEINQQLKPHQRAIVRWAIAGGRRAIFAAFGLGKSVIQIEIVRIIMARTGGFGLIVIPLGVRQEFMRDAAMLGVAVQFIRRMEEATDASVVYLTNYETVRDGHIDPNAFIVASLDEAAVLRGFGGTKTFREFMRLFAGDDRNTGVKTEGVRYRFVATATPSPNEYIELLAYSAYLEVMEVGQAKTRFFKRNSEKADKLTIHPHKEREFWLWVATWALFVTKPSDIDPVFSDEGYVLPPLDVRWHEIPSDHRNAGEEKDGQLRMFRNAAIGVQDSAREKRDSLEARVAKLMQIRAEDPDAHRLIWHDLEDERRAIEHAIPSCVTVYGSQDLDAREASVIAFSDGKIQELAGKPVMLGSGCNFQYHCHWSVFLGIGFKFKDFIQACHRVHRFLQAHTVRIDLIYTEAERDVRRQLERKWTQHNEMVERMTEIIREFGMAHAASAAQLARSLGVERVEASGEHYRCINNDCVVEAQSMPANSVDLIVTSIPFANQYEYTPSYNDFGHTDDNAHFWRQMDFLTPQLLRVLQPGRVCAIHVKDRITPGGINGLGFQTVTPVSDECVAHFIKHGFAFLARKTIVTDVVRENNQTYRLGWTEQCKDGSRMGAGMPEYMLIFRKPPSDPTNGYADLPVTKDKGTFTRPRWQFDAHGFTRSSGDRPLRPEELEGLEQAAIFKLFRKHSLENVYNFRHDVTIAESVDKSGWLPSTFMLLQPQSWHPDVWTDITRMRTMNTLQAQAGREHHICPLQFDIVNRCIEQYSMPGETVADFFGGLMTVPYCAVKLKRHGIGIELNNRYYLDGAAYCAAAERDLGMPTLFDAIESGAGCMKRHDTKPIHKTRQAHVPRMRQARRAHGRRQAVPLLQRVPAQELAARPRRCGPAMTAERASTETMSGVVRRATRGRKKPMVYGRLRVIMNKETGEAVRCIAFLGAADIENIRERNFKAGDLVRMQVSKATDPHANRTLHALGKMCAENLDAFSGMEAHAVLKRLQVESGVHCEPISVRIQGSDELAIANIPLSLSFDETDDFEFRACAHGLAKFLVQRYWPQVSESWIEEQLSKMVAKVESL